MDSNVLPNFRVAFDTKNTSDDSMEMMTKDQWDFSLNQLKESLIYHKDNSFIDCFTIKDAKVFVRKLIIDKLCVSLDKHKGCQMNYAARNRYLKTMAEFNNLPIIGCYAAYSVVNKFVTSRLRIEEDIVLCTTFFEEHESDNIAFSIEYQGECIIVGSGNPREIADKVFRLLIAYRK